MWLLPWPLEKKRGSNFKEISYVANVYGSPLNKVEELGFIVRDAGN
jgi:hypothetical protein